MKQNNNDIQNNHTLIDVNIPDSFDKLSIRDRITGVGSCFAQEMTDRLQDRCVDVTLNPFGTIYNPISIYQCLYYNFCVDAFGEENLCYESGKFFTPYHNTQFDSDTKEDILQKINGNLLYYKPRIQNSNVFLITYGTAVVYYYQKFLAANCHKLNQSLFRRDILSAETVKGCTLDLIELIRENVPNAKIIFTISPVRHKNPDLLTNSYGKALLKVGLTEALSECSDKNVIYFPSYEIALDQLRDYQYYKADGVHLTEAASDYIYSCFENVLFDRDSINAFAGIKNVLATLGHRSTDRTSRSCFDNLWNVYTALSELAERYQTAALNKKCKKTVKRMLKYFHNDNELLEKIKSTKTFQDNADKYNKKLAKWSKS